MVETGRKLNSLSVHDLVRKQDHTPKRFLEKNSFRLLNNKSTVLRHQMIRNQSIQTFKVSLDKPNKFLQFKKTRID